MCEPLQTGGLGIRNLFLFNHCFWGNGYGNMLWKGRRYGEGLLTQSTKVSVCVCVCVGVGGVVGVPIAYKGHMGFAFRRA